MKRNTILLRPQNTLNSPDQLKEKSYEFSLLIARVYVQRDFPHPETEAPIWVRLEC